MNVVNNEKTELKLISKISKGLREFLIPEIIIKQYFDDDIYENDIDKFLEKIERRNAVRRNRTRIPGQIAEEFINLIKDKVKEKNIDLGDLEIDISGIDFSIKDFVEKTKDLSYTLKIRIKSIEDLKNEDPQFLYRRYGITYLYAGSEYHIDDLFKLTENIKELVNENEDQIKCKEKSEKRASEIADIIFKKFELIVPEVRVYPKKEHVLVDGEKATMPPIRYIQDTSKYEKLENILSENKADFIGMKKILKECLRYDGYQMIETIESSINRVRNEMIINNEEYGIKVTETDMSIVKV